MFSWVAFRGLHFSRSRFNWTTLSIVKDSVKSEDTQLLYMYSCT